MNAIVEGSLQHKFTSIAWGHSGQVLSIAPHPSDTTTFATGGASDRIVAKWRKQRVQWKLEIQSAVCSLAWHPNGKAVLAGTEEGNLVALNGESGSLLPFHPFTSSSAR
jgi:WD40 repeat protein